MPELSMGLFPIGENLAVYDPRIAAKLRSLPAAIILQRIVWSINKHIEKYQTEQFFKGERWWMYDTFEDLANYSGLSRKQVMCAVKLLKARNLIQVEHFDKNLRNYRNYYSINVVPYFAVLESDKRELSRVTKGNSPECHLGTIDSDKRELSRVTKGNSLHTKSLPNPLSENQTERGREGPPPPKILTLNETGSQEEEAATPPEPGRQPPVDPNAETLPTPISSNEKPTESLLSPIELYEVYSAELVQQRGGVKVSASPIDLAVCRAVLNEFGHDGTKFLKAYLNISTNKFYREQHWPLRLVIQDKAKIAALMTGAVGTKQRSQSLYQQSVEFEQTLRRQE